MNYYIQKHNIPLYFIAIAYGRNIRGNIYSRMLISDNPTSQTSDYSREVSFEDIIDRYDIFENAQFSSVIKTGNNIPLHRTIVTLEEPIFWGYGSLIKVCHAPISLKTNAYTSIVIRNTYVPVKFNENLINTIEDELYELFNRKGVSYFPKKEYFEDYDRYIAKSLEDIRKSYNM